MSTAAELEKKKLLNAKFVSTKLGAIQNFKIKYRLPQIQWNRHSQAIFENVFEDLFWVIKRNYQLRWISVFSSKRKNWPELESNQRHKDFQSSALPTELSGQVNESI